MTALSRKDMVAKARQALPSTEPEEVRTLVLLDDRPRFIGRVAVHHAELDAPLQLVVDPDGHVELVSRTGTWLTPQRRAVIAAIIGRAERGPTFEPIVEIDGARATMVRLYGASVRYLVTLEAIVAPELSPDLLLTPRQREVADYACVGATAREIGETLGLSSETVRDHLKEIYRRLGIASRVELVHLLRPGSGRGPDEERSIP